MNIIYVVGIGPGAYDKMTLEAVDIIKACDVIAGYTVYAKLLKAYFPDKIYIDTPMKKEEERCRLAFEVAQKGQRVALVCSGDAGVYGLSGLMLSLERDYPDCRVEIIAGVTSALSGAALIGAPLIHDFALISLSDLLTPWEKIEKRLRYAAASDFVIVLYNPSSKSRADYLKKACDIILSEQSDKIECAVVRNIAREGESSVFMNLGELREYKADMFCTVFIGNTMTKRIGKRIVTPRGYKGERL